jgi:carbonic anhydrase/acetyltransferase-like protein (isoleucine patch superfamily)
MLCFVQIEKGAMVAAGAIVGPGTIIPAGEIWGGKPAKHLRALTPEEQAFLKGVCCPTFYTSQLSLHQMLFERIMIN